MKFIFSPATQSDLMIAQLPIFEMMDQIVDEDKYIEIDVVGKKYKVNIGASRLRIIKKNPFCACCGIGATECFLDLDAKATKEAGEPRYHINFYARTGVKNSDNQHMILLTRDHIIPRFKGGDETEENSQTLCFNCNSLKDSTEMNLEQMKKALFPAYRAYQSSKALNLAKDRLHLHRTALGKSKMAVQKITQALAVVTDFRADGLKEKRDKAQRTMKKLADYIAGIEIEAQLTGVVPEIDDVSSFYQ